MFKEQLFIILIINIHSSSCALDDIYDAGKQLWKLYAIIDKMESNSTGETCSDTGMIIQEIDTQIDKIDEQLELIENSMHPKMILESVRTWLLNAIIFKNIDTLEIFILKIDKNYAKFQRGRKMSESLDPESSLDADGDITMIRKIITDGKDSPSGDLPSAITAFATIHHDEICNSSQIISNILIQMFRMIVIAEIKANIMSSIADVHRHIQNGRQREVQDVNRLSRMVFVEYFGIYLNIFLINFSLMDTTYWRACDPVTGVWIRGKSFFEIEETFQTTLFRYHWFKCKYDSCYDVMVHKSRKCKPEFYDYRSSCEGRIADCSYLSSIQACVLKRGPYKFQYVNSTELGYLGTNFECPKHDGYIIQDGMGWNSSYAACACNCVDARNEISLSIIESNVKFNRVIVGLRFNLLDRILYIQPREAILGANGYVHPHTQRWIEIPRNIAPSLIGRIDEENKVFFLDDLRLPSTYVLTGVKFNKVTRGTVTGYALEIFGVHFDYKSGKLSSQGELKLSKRSLNTAPGESLQFEAVSSIYSELRHQVTLSNGRYVSLQQSRLKEDFGQSTLPLFDATTISIRLPSALSGIGIFHKGVEGYAGFISLRVFGITYEKYFQDLKFSHMNHNKVLFNDSHNH